MDEFDKKIKRAYFLRLQAKSLSEEADEILASLGDTIGKYPAGEFIYQVTPTVRFDAATAKKNLKPEDFQKILKESPNAALAKAVLDETTYKATQKVHGVTRKIIPVTDEED